MQLLDRMASFVRNYQTLPSKVAIPVLYFWASLSVTALLAWTRSLGCQLRENRPAIPPFLSVSGSLAKGMKTEVLPLPLLKEWKQRIFSSHRSCDGEATLVIWNPQVTSLGRGNGPTALEGQPVPCGSKFLAWARAHGLEKAAAGLMCGAVGSYILEAPVKVMPLGFEHPAPLHVPLL